MLAGLAQAPACLLMHRKIHTRKMAAEGKREREREIETIVVLVAVVVVVVAVVVLL